MSEGVIEFPENYHNHLNLGETAFQEERYNEALTHFQAAYNMENEPTANRWLVKTALVLNEFELASKIAEERLNDYLANSEYLVMYLDALIGQKKFQRARLFIEVYADSEVKAQQSTVLQQAEEHALRFDSRKIQENMTKLATWYPEPHEIVAFLDSLNELPYEKFMERVLAILKDKRHSLMLRNQLLNTLRLLKVEKAVHIIDYQEQTREVTPSTLEIMGREQTYLQVSAILNKLVGEQPNVLNQLLADQRRFFNIVYPLAKKDIRSVENWLSVTLAPYNGLVRLPIDEQALEEVAELTVFNQVLAKMGLKP
ncbi:hypothetical protein [Vagococcus zengguangii]|uniref:Uncharacterized protein n=1 Tax=Vagococcus zengguangii TaxID=2571750 RepID=A0A4D7CT54_9ENTE|nr:hypothetical protein [Vagococcus zengguangii]QCI85972.1 hypothetical protein FA707_02900 [Vagococcus zengguangii]TLG80283.1 hypothetical protein FE258_06245 [Vagococcus zengguangii]